MSISAFPVSVHPRLFSALTIRQSLRHFHRDHVFGRGDNAEGFAGWSTPKKALDERLPGMPKWTLHDLRRSFVTGMAELGVQPHIIEMAINHQSGHKAGVAGTYNRANYHAERKVALDKWAAHIMALVTKRPFVVVAKAA